MFCFFLRKVGRLGSRVWGWMLVCSFERTCFPVVVPLERDVGWGWMAAFSMFFFCFKFIV